MDLTNNHIPLCFHGDCLIKTESGKFKLIKNLKKDDKIISLNNPYNSKQGTSLASVLCVLQTNINSNNISFVNLKGGLKLTPSHPILILNEWIYPYSLGQIKFENCSSVYSILLDSLHTCNINGIWCVTLAHNYKIGILYNTYYGTDEIISDIKKFNGWHEGKIIIESNKIIRDYITNSVINISNY